LPSGRLWYHGNQFSEDNIKKWLSFNPTLLAKYSPWFCTCAFPTFASDASSRLGKYATVFAIGGYGSTRSTETPARAFTAQLLCLDS